MQRTHRTLLCCFWRKRADIYYLTHFTGSNTQCMFIGFAYQCEIHMSLYTSWVTIDIRRFLHSTQLIKTTDTYLQIRPSLSSPPLSSPAIWGLQTANWVCKWVYRFDAEEQKDGQQNKNEIGASECDVKDINSLLGTETASSRTCVNYNNRHTRLERLTTESIH